MANETSSANPSLPLHEVLESEFVALHGKLPADYPSSTESETRLKAFWAAVHGLKEKRAALSFADLGEAVRKIRVDFGIPIEFGPMSIYPRSQIDTLKVPGHNSAIGRIRYSVVDGSAAPDGILVYIKPACYGDEPRDIYEYFKTSKTFPHESTADQFFSESQFESYRMLGSHTMEKLCTDCRGDFCCFIRDILKGHLEMEAPDWLAKLLEAPENEKDVRNSRSEIANA